MAEPITCLGCLRPPAEDTGYFRLYGKDEPFVVCRPCLEGMSLFERSLLLSASSFLELMRERFWPDFVTKPPEAPQPGDVVREAHFDKPPGQPPGAHIKKMLDDKRERSADHAGRTDGPTPAGAS